MAETVRAVRIEVKITAQVAGDNGAQLVTIMDYDKVLNEGTGTDQVGSVWYDEERSLASTSEDLDFSGSALTDFQGADLAFNNLKLLAIRNIDTDSGDYLLLKEGSSNTMADPLGGTSPTVKIGPDGLLLLVSPVDGYTVTDGSADVLAVEAVDSSKYEVLAAGDNA